MLYYLMMPQLAVFLMADFLLMHHPPYPHPTQFDRIEGLHVDETLELTLLGRAGKHLMLVIRGKNCSL